MFDEDDNFDYVVPLENEKVEKDMDDVCLWRYRHLAKVRFKIY